MIETSSELTLKLSIAFGAYMLVAGPTGFYARDRWYGILEGIDNAPALSYVTGAFVFILGCAMILTHNIWSDFLAGFISLVGWVAAIEGLIIIAMPNVLIKFCRSIMSPALVTGFAGFTTLGGALLILLGLTGQVAS